MSTPVNIPSLPTDNLYKLVTMSGALLAVLPLVYLVLSTNDLKLKVAETEGSVRTAEVESQRLKEMGIDATSQPKDEYSQKRIIRYLDLLSQCRRLNERDKALLGNIQELRTIVYASVLIGSVLFVAGSLLWYLKLQRKEDLLIEAEVRSKENEV